MNKPDALYLPWRSTRTAFSEGQCLASGGQYSSGQSKQERSMRLGPKMKKAIELMQDGRIYKAAELNEAGLDKRVIKRLVEAEVIGKFADLRGRYYLCDQYLEGHAFSHEKSLILDDFLEATFAGGPSTVMCFYAAANFHNMGEDSFAEMHAAIPHARGCPKSSTLFRFLRFRSSSDFDFEAGVETISYRGVDLKITGKVRTAIDMLRFSPFNKSMSKPQVCIDQESAAKALAECQSDRSILPADISRMARLFKVEHCVDPALETGHHLLQEVNHGPGFG